MSRRIAIVCAAALLGLAGQSAAQERPSSGRGTPARIVGTITDAESHDPIEGVSVRVSDLDRPAVLTDRHGRFVLTDIAAGVHQLQIEHIAYGRGVQTVTMPERETLEFEASLRKNPIVLDSLIVNVRARVSTLDRVGFFDRQRRGFGHFFRDEEAAAWRITQIVRRVPRMEIGGFRTGRRVILRQPGRGACIPYIYLDGVYQRWAEGDVEQVAAGLDIEAIEIYRGIDTPMEFVPAAATRPCGAIVIWTRR